MRRWIVLALVLFAGAAVATAAVLARDGDDEDGPLDSGAASGFGQSMEVGESATAAHVWLFNHGNEPARIEQIRILGATAGMELVGVQTKLFPNGDVPFLGTRGYPIEDYPARAFAQNNVVPVVEARTPGGDPDSFLQLLIGVRTTKQGVVQSEAVEITYRVGDRRYREVLDHSIALCTPRDRGDESCPPDEARDQFGDRALTFPPPGS